MGVSRMITDKVITDAFNEKACAEELLNIIGK